MSTTPDVDLWSVLPATLKRAGLVAVTTLFLASALLYQENTGSEQPSEISRGAAPGNLANPAPDQIVVATPTPAPAGESRSAATLRVPRRSLTEPEVKGPPFPTLGRYIFSVDGTEEFASLFGSRRYAPEMTMTVHRREPGTSSDPNLRANELAFDLDFSPEHQERAIVAYDTEGLEFTFEAASVTFGPRTQSGELSYDPPITQIPIPVALGAEASGTTQALDPDDRSVVRVEDWTVSVVRRETIQLMGSDVDTFVVQVDRQTQPGSSEQVTRSRTYWLDPLRAIWVKWEEHLSSRQGSGLGSVAYTTDYTATLDRIEPL